MEIFQYTEEHKQYRRRLREFMDKEVVPYADQWEKDHIIPKSVWKKMGEQGFLCTCVSPEYGGIGGDFLYSVIGVEELARTNQSGLMTHLHSDIVVPYIVSYGTEDQKQKYLPGCVKGDIITAVAMTEPDAGSDLSSMTSTAVEEGDEIVINGSKTFISNGLNSDLIVVAAKDPEIDNPYQAISLYLVESDNPGFKRGRRLEKMGMHSQDTAELFFNNCRIPKTSLLGQKGGGFLILMDKLQQERLVCSLGGVVGSELMLEYVTNFCKTKTDASGKPLSKYQAVLFALVEMATEVKIGRNFVDKLILEHMSGQNVAIETSMAKYWTTDLIKRVGDRALDLTGEFGTLEECRIVRAWRDARILSIFAGTNEIMKGIVGKFMGL